MSAYELRAKYKVGARDVSKPIEIRRRNGQAIGDPKTRAEVDDQAAVTERIMPDDHADNGPSERAQVGPMSPLLLEQDPTLRRISAGPYANLEAEMPSTDSDLTRDYGKVIGKGDEPDIDEKLMISVAPNTSAKPTGHPPLEALSSAEWLTGGDVAQYRPNPSRGPDVLTSMPSKASPVVSSRAIVRKPVNGSKENLRLRDSAQAVRCSPGQRMATSWLDGRRAGVVFELGNGTDRLRELEESPGARRVSGKECTPAFV
jgi:hypothetical protein